jgi:hypothetical protein
MKTYITKAFLCIILSIIAFSPELRAAEPPPLSKADALKIISSMGYQNVAIGGVIQGVGTLTLAAFSSSSVAMVVAYGEKDGQPQKIQETFFYDKDLGWFYYEIDTNGKRVRLWTVNGYSEVTPPKKPSDQK